MPDYEAAEFLGALFDPRGPGPQAQPPEAEPAACEPEGGGEPPDGDRPDHGQPEAHGQQPEPEPTPEADDLPAWTDPALWRRVTGGMVRIDCPPADGELVEPADWECPTCGGLAWWEGIDGRRHCQTCERAGLERGDRLAEKAARLRAGAPGHSPRKKPPRGT